MKASEDFKKEAMATHIALAFVDIAILIGIAIALVNGEFGALVFIIFPVFFTVILVICYRDDKKTYREIREQEAQEEQLTERQLTSSTPEKIAQ